MRLEIQHLFHSVTELNNQTDNLLSAETVFSVLLDVPGGVTVTQNTQTHGSRELRADIICYLDYIWECGAA